MDPATLAALAGAGKALGGLLGGTRQRVAVSSALSSATNVAVSPNIQISVGGGQVGSGSASGTASGTASATAPIDQPDNLSLPLFGGGGLGLPAATADIDDLPPELLDAAKFGDMSNMLLIGGAALAAFMLLS